MNTNETNELENIISDLPVTAEQQGQVKGGSDVIHPGDTASFTITVTNDGAGPTSTTRGRGLFTVSTSPIRP